MIYLICTGKGFPCPDIVGFIRKLQEKGFLMMHNVSVRTLEAAERRFKNDLEMQMNEVCISLCGREKDFDNIYVLTVDDDLAARMAANAIDFFFDEDIESVVITLIDRENRGIQFTI